MGEEKSPQSWWATVPSLWTAAAGTITALSGLILALNQAGVFKLQATANSVRSRLAPALRRA